jgi:hypothetical protein
MVVWLGLPQGEGVIISLMLCILTGKQTSAPSIGSVASGQAIMAWLVIPYYRGCVWSTQ